MPTGDYWTAEEDAVLRRLWADRVKKAAIRAALPGRSQRAIAGRLRFLLQHPSSVVARTNLSMDAKKARVRIRWAEGISTAAIGRELGITKNAVIGMAHRQNLPSRASPIIRGDGPAKRPRLPPLPLPPLTSVVSAPPAASVVRRMPTAPRPVLVEAFGLPVAPRVFSQCCWPVGEPGTRAFRYCDADVMDRGPYCAEHRKLGVAKTAQQQHMEEAA